MQRYENVVKMYFEAPNNNILTTFQECSTYKNVAGIYT